MTDIGRGVTKEETDVPYISHSCISFPFMWSSLRLAPIIQARGEISIDPGIQPGFELGTLLVKHSYHRAIESR